jgi:hypothetical protein
MQIRSISILFLVLIIPIVSEIPSIAQQDDKYVEEESQEHILDVGIGYSSNSSISGNNTSSALKNAKKTLFVNSDIVQPTFSPNIIYNAPFGLSLSAFANIIGNSDSTQTKSTTEFDLSIGYNLALLNDKLSIYPSFTHYFYSKNSTSVTSLLKNQLSLDVSYDFNWMYLSVGGTYMNGEKNDYGLNSQLYFPITFEKFITANGQLLISPGASVVFGNQSYNSDLLIQNILDKTNSKKIWRRSILTIGDIEKYSTMKKKLLALNKLVFGNETIDSNERWSDYLKRVNQAIEPKFKLTSVGVLLPIYYTINNFSVNFSVSYQIARNTANPNAKLFKFSSNQSDNITSILFSAGLTYSFIW